MKRKQLKVEFLVYSVIPLLKQLNLKILKIRDYLHIIAKSYGTCLPAIFSVLNNDEVKSIQKEFKLDDEFSTSYRSIKCIRHKSPKEYYNEKEEDVINYNVVKEGNKLSNLVGEMPSMPGIGSLGIDVNKAGKDIPGRCSRC